MKILYRPAAIRSISGVLINLSAGWFATVFILPLQGFIGHVSFAQLILNLVYAIVCLKLSIRLEELLDL